MTFDPFGDYSTRGYLRNVLGKDEAVAKRLEHTAFRATIDSALEYLQLKSALKYEDVLQTHANLFSAVYPWAGQDRTQTAPNSAIGKAGNFDLFSHPGDSRRAIETALQMAADKSTMRTKLGEIMGYLAYAHPFLDGNGRTILTVHIDLCRRAGMSIDWSRTNKDDYLVALTKELDSPGKGHLDTYLKPLIEAQSIERAQAGEMLRSIPGLGPSEARPSVAVLIPRRNFDPEVTKSDIETAINANAAFVESDGKLEKIAASVYRNPTEVVNDIRKAALTGPIGDRSVAKRIELDPDSYGSYKGAGGIFSSQQERKDYRNAVAARTFLKGAADHIISTAHSIRMAAAQGKRELSERGKVEILYPDASLLSAIGKKQPLSEAQSSDIDKAVRQFDHRFGNDVGKLRTARNLEPLSQKHGIDAQQLLQARRVLKILDKGQSLAREQAKAISESKNIGDSGFTR